MYLEAKSLIATTSSFHKRNTVLFFLQIPFFLSLLPLITATLGQSTIIQIGGFIIFQTAPYLE